MPSGNVHFAISAAATPLVVLAVYSAQGFIPAACAGAGCLLGGSVLTPDLDLPRGGLLWRVLWWPYQAVIPHRSIFSHLPVLGTLLRVFYLALVWLVLSALFGLQVDIDPALPYLGWLVVGLIVSDCLHTLADCLI